MNFVVTQNAREALQRQGVNPSRGLRISAELEEGSCSCTVSVQFRLDNPQQGDMVAESEGVHVLMDKASHQLLESDTFSIDIQDGVGFVLRTPNETIAYGIRILASQPSNEANV